MNENKWVLSFGKETKSIVKLTSVIVKLTFALPNPSHVLIWILVAALLICCMMEYTMIKWMERDRTVSIKTLNRASRVSFTPFGGSLFSASQQSKTRFVCVNSKCLCHKHIQSNIMHQNRLRLALAHCINDQRHQPAKNIRLFCLFAVFYFPSNSFFFSSFASSFSSIHFQF